MFRVLKTPPLPPCVIIDQTTNEAWLYIYLETTQSLAMHLCFSWPLERPTTVHGFGLGQGELHSKLGAHMATYLYTGVI